MAILVFLRPILALIYKALNISLCVVRNGVWVVRFGEAMVRFGKTAVRNGDNKHCIVFESNLYSLRSYTLLSRISTNVITIAPSGGRWQRRFGERMKASIRPAVTSLSSRLGRSPQEMPLGRIGGSRAHRWAATRAYALGVNRKCCRSFCVAHSPFRLLLPPERQETTQWAVHHEEGEIGQKAAP
jgi:hypothetical protein